MKPHIRLKFGIWSCVTLFAPAAIGCGATPAEAYAEWDADRKRVGRFL